MLLSNFSGCRLEAGCDEAGRGCLAGPVVAAAVILPPDYKHNLLNDSKQLTAHQRSLIRADIEKDALYHQVAEASPTEIDEINILQASILAMHRALDGLKIHPEFIIVDGNKFRDYKAVKSQCIVGGDATYLSIAAASILAKTHRDTLMRQLAATFPYYGWERNVGYPTRQHRNAIKQYGITIHHRRSFRLLENQITLFD